jgi:uncharacterized protein (DUF1778 family)
MSSDDKPKKKNRTGSEQRKRQPRITFRVSTEEVEAIKSAALAAGLSVGSFLRSLALAMPRTRAVRAVSPDVANVRQFLGQVGRYTGNLKQLVRSVNFGSTPDARELAAIALEAQAFLDAARAALKGA